MRIYNKVLEYIRWDVGNGNRIRFWQDAQVGKTSLLSRFPNIFAFAKDKHILLRDAFSGIDHRVCSISVCKNLNDWKIEDYDGFLSLMSSVQLNDTVEL